MNELNFKLRHQKGYLDIHWKVYQQKKQKEVVAKLQNQF